MFYVGNVCFIWLESPFGPPFPLFGVRGGVSNFFSGEPRHPLLRATPELKFASTSCKVLPSSLLSIKLPEVGCWDVAGGLEFDKRCKRLRIFQQKPKLFLPQLYERRQHNRSRFMREAACMFSIYGRNPSISLRVIHVKV